MSEIHEVTIHISKPWEQADGSTWYQGWTTGFYHNPEISTYFTSPDKFIEQIRADVARHERLSVFPHSHQVSIVCH